MNIVTTDNAWTGENFRRGGYLTTTPTGTSMLKHSSRWPGSTGEAR